VTNPAPTIAVDLTPLLPGGENGGAKAFTLTLLGALAAARPAARFELLTQAASHEELAVLEGGNIRRVLALGAGTTAFRSRVFAAASFAMRHSPIGLRTRVARLGYRIHSLLKSGAGGLPDGVRADLLFCPFTAPAFHSPERPTVCTVYDLQYVAYPQFFAVEDVVLRERAFSDAGRSATLLAAISDFARESAIRHGKLEPARVRTILLRMARAGGTADAPALLARLKLEPGAYLLYPANFWRHKNHEMLLTAFGLAASTLDVRIKLVFTGTEGSRQRAMLEAARAMGLGGRIVHAGYLPGEEMHALMSAAGALVFPSLYEGFGLPVTEAMALGVPVACSNTTALPEVAGDAALQFDPRKPEEVAAAIVSVMTDSSLRARLAQAGRERALEYIDTARMAREYWELFDEAMSRSAGRT